MSTALNTPRPPSEAPILHLVDDRDTLVRTQTPAPPVLPEIREAQMPQAQGGVRADGRTDRTRGVRDVVRLVLVTSVAATVVFVYIGVPMALLVGNWLDSLLHAAMFAAAGIAFGAAITLGVLHSTNKEIETQSTWRPTDGTGPDRVDGPQPSPLGDAATARIPATSGAGR